MYEGSQEPSLSKFCRCAALLMSSGSFIPKRKEQSMHAIRTHVAGVDVHKQILAITTLIGAADKEPTFEQFECNTFTEDLMAMCTSPRSVDTKMFT